MKTQVWVLIVLASTSWAGTGFPQGFSESELLAGAPDGGSLSVTALAWAPDTTNRLFFLRQGNPRGVEPRDGAEIRIIQNGVLLPTPFAVVQPVLHWSECGLLGIAFDPNFLSNGYVYVSACVSSTEQQIIRYQAVGNVGMNKTVILGGLPTVGDTHNGGGISIGPDGKLYWAIGDNRLTIGHDLDLTSLTCKVGRANLDGSAPNDNPFYDGPGPNNDYIYARGFRNPFTHTWKPGTHQLWVNDVGGHGEQIFKVRPGDHGGWDDYGGGNQPMNHPTVSYIRPVFMVQSAGASGAAITGSTFYDGTLFPTQYRGNYFIGDFEVPGRIIRAVLNADDSLNAQSVFGTDILNIVGIRVGPDGALYYATWNGNVYRLTYNNPSQGIVVERQHVSMLEGSSVVVGVRLAQAPSGNVAVSAVHASGDADISTSGSLTFTPQNWEAPQFVTIVAAEDADTMLDTASLNLVSNGLPTVPVEVQATDNDSQGLVLSSSVVSLGEGATATFTVRLASMPAADVTVTVARAGGDADLTVSSGASLTFTPANFNLAQTVTIAAAEDTDTTADTATFTVAASGAPSRTVTATAQDNDNAAPVITTTPVTVAIVGIPYSYDVDATGLPTPTFSLTAAPNGMAIDPTSGAIMWVPMTVGVVNVTIQASNGQLPNGTQSFTIDVRADQPPTAHLSSPQSGGTIAGRVEFFGDGRDDAATVRAEFFVDDVLVYTDSTPGDHYHYGGSNGHTQNRFDTTPLTNGPHVFRMTVYDARNQSGSAQAMVTVSNAVASDGGIDSDAGTDAGPSSSHDAGPLGGSDAGAPGSAPERVIGRCGCSSSNAALEVLLLAALALRRRRSEAVRSVR